MTTNPLAALTTGLEGASDAKLLEVVAILDRLADRGPADQLLQPVRARLARLRPPRPLTLRRVLVLPFEDLLVQAGDYQPERRRLSRATLRPLLDIALSGLEPGLARTLEAAARGRDMREGDVVLSVGERLWPAAHRALVARLAADAPTPEAAAQLAAVAELLPLAHAIVTTLWELPPRPMGPLSPEAVGIAAPAGGGRPPARAGSRPGGCWSCCSPARARPTSSSHRSARPGSACRARSGTRPWRGSCAVGSPSCARPPSASRAAGTSPPAPTIWST